MSNFALIEEAWNSPPISSSQNDFHIFMEDQKEKYQRGSYADSFNEHKEKAYNFESKPNIIKNTLPENIDKKNYQYRKSEHAEDYNLQEFEKVNDTKKENFENSEKFQELQNYIKTLEVENKSLKLNKMKQTQSLFGNVNNNEMIILISFGVLLIMVLDSFTRLGKGLNRS